MLPVHVPILLPLRRLCLSWGELGIEQKGREDTSCIKRGKEDWITEIYRPFICTIESALLSRIYFVGGRASTSRHVVRSGA
jgi:hypothetical protein